MAVRRGSRAMVAGRPGNDDLLLSREWLVANGLS